MTIRPIKATIERTAGSTDDQTLPPDWMTFPALNEAWTHSVDGTLALMVERRKTLQALIASAPPAERARARLLAHSYVRVHAVLEELNSAYTDTTSTERNAI